jgi:hypothetical protein
MCNEVCKEAMQIMGSGITTADGTRGILNPGAASLAARERPSNRGMPTPFGYDAAIMKKTNTVEKDPVKKAAPKKAAPKKAAPKKVVSRKLKKTNTNDK